MFGERNIAVKKEKAARGMVKCAVELEQLFVGQRGDFLRIAAGIKGVGKSGMRWRKRECVRRSSAELIAPFISL